MGPTFIYYNVNSIGREFNWTRKDCPQMRTVGYNGLRAYKYRMCYKKIEITNFQFKS